MRNIFLVDDDVDFLESVQYIDIRNANLHTFSSPLKAIEAFQNLKPSIIVSDIQMPGISGVHFSLIARELMFPEHFIYISANSRDDIEKKFGSLEGISFFRKPLENNFFDFLSEISEKPEIQKNPGEKSTSVMDELNNILKSWKPVKRYANDPDPQNPHEFETNFHGMSAVLAFSMSGEWIITCKELGLDEAKVGKNVQDAIKESGEKLIQARKSLLSKLAS